MPKKRKETLWRTLAKKKEEILKEAKEAIGGHFDGERRIMVETALDDGDWSIVDLEEDVDMAILERHKDNLNKIEEAVRKLEEGTYGICEECGQEISEKRLNALPFAIYCIDCQQRKEELEEIEKEEERE
jgi:DnaK suppressor protein